MFLFIDKCTSNSDCPPTLKCQRGRNDVIECHDPCYYAEYYCKLEGKICVTRSHTAICEDESFPGLPGKKIDMKKG